MLEHVLHPQPGYPFALHLTVEYALSDEGLSVATTATNVGPGACPYGCGFHPYLTLGTPTVDSLVLTVPARAVLRSDEPQPSHRPGGRRRHGVRLHASRGRSARRGSTTASPTSSGTDGLARVELRSPEDGAGLTLWLDDAYGYVMLFTGDPLPDVDRRSVAVEPMTCPPNAFRSGEALIRLEPGRSFTSTWGITPTLPA